MRRLCVSVGRLVAAISAVMMVVSTHLAAATLGSTIQNTATVSYILDGYPTTFVTAPATFVVQARPTPSTIEFFRIAPAAPDAVSVRLHGSDYATDGVAAFTPIGQITMAGGAAIDLAQPVKIVPTTDYFSGEPIIVRVSDAGQNGDPAAIETVTTTIVSEAGDRVVLRLYESGPNTGVFYGYIQSANGAFATNDPILAVAQGEELIATYIDPFDATEVSTDVAGVDPFGRLFDSTNGQLTSGVTVTIVDDATGLPATVYGIDGVSAYPSTLTTGTTVTDAGGMVYTLSPGEFRFPIVLPGRYRLVVTAPAGYSAPSLATPADIAALTGGPFVISSASFLAAFDLTGTGDVQFDVPIDPRSDLIVAKEASAATAAIGDFIRYELVVANNGGATSAVILRDRLPTGFRYQPGSARVAGTAVVDPTISPDGSTLVFAPVIVPAGDTARLAYVAEVSAGARRGDAVNSAAAIDQNGLAISNTAEATVYIQEDLLRSRLTIVGRVAVDACNPDERAPRRLSRGEGVPGVRVVMETGAYALTDEDGLYHFEDVTTGTHVVQIDTESIPEGYDVVRCEANTRFAGSAISQFVDAQGGSLWRANFYLKRNVAAARTQEAAQEAQQKKAPVNDATEYKKYDQAWLEFQSPDPAIVYPAEGRTASARAVHLGVKHPVGTSVKLFVNGAPAPPFNFAGREVNSLRTTALTRFRGVDIGDGETVLSAIVVDGDNREITRLERRFYFVDKALRAEFLEEESVLIADGRNAPLIAVRITDEAGRTVHGGRQIDVIIDPPYRTKATTRVEDALPVSAPLAAESAASVGPDGVLRIELEPTVQTGRLRAVVKLDDGREEEIFAYLKPAMRDWIVVGLAEGKGALEKSSGALPKGKELVGEGRIAVFAKGAVKGGWLVTAAGDTAKGRGREDDELFDAIDPDARYPLYGDKSTQEFEAESRFPVFLKVEKDAFQALLGDYDTALSVSKLARYQRRMSGVRTIYESKNWSFTGFAADTNQTFQRDEVPADGTSGPYLVTAAPMVRNSETVIVQSRDRFRPDLIKSSTPYMRYIDYDIDFRTGEIVFRLPIAAADDLESLNVIVVEYETSAPVKRNVTAGGRLARRFLDQRAELGLTAIHEQAPNGLREGGDLGAVDATYKVSKTTEARVEYGRTRRETLTGHANADAFLAELTHISKSLQANAYYQEVDQNYGLKHQSSAVVGVRRFGAELAFKFQELTRQKTGAKVARYVDGKAYREENLATGATRSLAEIGLRQENATTSAAVGLRGVVEAPASGPTRRALLSTLDFKHSFDKLGLTLRGQRDQPIASSGDSNLFPKRTILGLDQRLWDVATLSVSHEIQEGDDASSGNTIVGLKADPWKGATISLAGDMVASDTGRRVGATFGLDQTVKITDKWTGSFGMSRRQQLSSDGAVDAPDDIVPDSPVSPLETDRNFTSIHIGAGYQSGATSGSTRFEHRKSEFGQRYTGIVGAAREVNEAFSFAAAARYEQNENQAAADSKALDARLGLALRPRASDKLIIFNRFDVKIDNVEGEFSSWKAINNLALNFMPDERWQVSLNHGIKYAQLFDGASTYEGLTQLLGLETRFDLTSSIDIGFRGMGLYSHNSHVLDYAYGPSIGVNPADNIWIGFGYNIVGLRDDDFIAAEYAQKGPFIQLRVKFDQRTARGLLDLISPEKSR